MKINISPSTARIALLVIILALLSACTPKPEASDELPLVEITLGYCPTMQPHAQALAGAHHNITLQQYENSSIALEALKAGRIQAALIGRVAWPHEHTDDLRLVRLIDGLTLIAQQPGVIRFEDLPKIRILTHELEAAIQDLIPVRNNIIYYDDFNQMRSAFDGTVAVLLRWSQVGPSDNLLIPVDGYGNKIAVFRSPHFYFLASMEASLGPLLNTFSTD